jgi:hypothetical protein
MEPGEEGRVETGQTKFGTLEEVMSELSIVLSRIIPFIQDEDRKYETHIMIKSLSNMPEILLRMWVSMNIPSNKKLRKIWQEQYAISLGLDEQKERPAVVFYHKEIRAKVSELLSALVLL